MLLRKLIVFLSLVRKKKKIRRFPEWKNGGFFMASCLEN